MSCSGTMGILVGVALLASTVTLILTLLVVLLLWKPDFFHKRWRKQKRSSVDSSASPSYHHHHHHHHPSQLSLIQRLPPIQEESEETETLFVSLGTQTDFDTELDSEKHASHSTSPTSPSYSATGGQIRKRSRVSRSSIISNLLGRRSGDHEQDPEEVFDLMSAEEREHMSNSDEEEDEIKDSVFLGAVVDLQFEQGESSV